MCISHHFHGVTNIFGFRINMGIVFHSREGDGDMKNWCCSHAPKGFQLAVVILSWIVFILFVCMPHPVRGQFLLRKNNVQDFLQFHACGDHIKAKANPALDSLYPIFMIKEENIIIYNCFVQRVNIYALILKLCVFHAHWLVSRFK